MLILYVDDILIMSGDRNTRVWVRDLLQKEYDKITFDEEEKFTYAADLWHQENSAMQKCVLSYNDYPIPWSRHLQMNIAVFDLIRSLKMHDFSKKQMKHTQGQIHKSQEASFQIKGRIRY